LKAPAKLSYALVAACLAAILSAWSIHKRYEIESENRAVSLAAEYETIESLAAAQSLPMDRALVDLRAQGLSSVVLSEETIGELIADGKASLEPYVDLTEPASVGGGPHIKLYPLALRVGDTGSLRRIQRGLKIRFGDLAMNLAVKGELVQLPAVSPQLIRTTSIGLNPDQAQVAATGGMSVIARFINPGGITKQGIYDTLEWARELGAKVFLPQGDEVLGRRDSLPDTIDALHRMGMFYASAEFAKIAGDTEMVEQAPDLVIRLHAAQTAELDKLTPVDAIDRYTRAARERNMRILLIRPISFSGPLGPLGELDDFVKKIADGLLAKGNTLGFPHGYSEPGIPRLFFPILGLLMCPVIWFVGAAFVESRPIRIAGGVLLVLLAGACVTRHGPPLMALLGSMAFPIFAFLMLDEFLKKRNSASLTNVVAAFWIVSALSLTGGLCVAGMLNGLDYYVKAKEFPAIKVAEFAPIILVGLFYFLRLTDWRGAMKSPITWGASLTGLLVGAALAFMWLRTGNDSGVGPSGGEMVFRNQLDRWLYVRPRTKEFLVGHPFLIVAIGMLARAVQPDTAAKRPAFACWIVLMLMIGAIGQTSIVNTLCHLHIPVVLSLARDVEGLVLGCIIGVVVWVVIKRPILRTEA